MPTRREVLIAGVASLTALIGDSVIAPQAQSKAKEITQPSLSPLPENSAPPVPYPMPEASEAPAELFIPKPPPTPEPTPQPTPELVKFNPSDIVFWGDRTKPYVYLTIDDCYDKKAVETALDIAKDLEVKLTFFPIGAEIAKGPASLWKRAVAEGHAIENHSQNHLWLPDLTDDGIRSQIDLQRKTVENILGQPYKQRFFRPSGGGGILGGVQPRIPNIAKELGYEIAMWSDDSSGPKYYPKTDAATINTIISNVATYLSKGAIVLQHAISNDILALPQVIKMAKSRGLECITMQKGIS